MSVAATVLLVGAGVAAGLSGSIAGLASLFSYPALLAVGLPATSANVTNTVSLAVSSVGAVGGSLPELRGQAARVRGLGLLCAAGGAAGAGLLLLTPSGVFERVVPFLVGAASLVLLLVRPAPARAAVPETAVVPGDAVVSGDGVVPGDPVVPGDAVVSRDGVVPGVAEPAGGVTPAAAARIGGGPAARLGVLAVAVYGGYFGAAAGVMLLALLVALLPETLARVNALKNVLLGLANAVAAVGFAVFGHVSWTAALPLTAGLVVGNLTGPWVVRRLPAGPLRIAIALAGLGLAVKLALDAW